MSAPEHWKGSNPMWFARKARLTGKVKIFGSLLNSFSRFSLAQFLSRKFEVTDAVFAVNNQSENSAQAGQ